MRPFTKLTTASAIALIAATPLAAQELDPRMELMDFFAPDRIATGLAHIGISAIRTQMEFQYDHLSVDPLRGLVSISGITARPVLPYDQARQCEVTVERATITSDFTQPFQTTAEVDFNLIGGRVALACVEPEVALALRTAGYKAIPLDQFKVRASYAYTTGETAVDATLAVNGLATLDVSGSGTILPRLGEFGYPGDPAIRVSRAVLSLKDDGGWAAASELLPPNLRDPATVRQLATQGVTDALTQGGTLPLGAVERRFIDELMARVEAYVTDPGEITLQADLPADGITIEPEMYENPVSLITALNLQARTAPLQRTEIVGTDTLASLADPSGLTDSERLELAGRLLDGDGVPRSSVAARDLLAPMLDNPDSAGPAALLLAEAVADTDVGLAYDLGLRAAASAMPGAVSVLDRLEARMSTGAVMTAQQAYFDGEPEPITMVQGDDPRDLRRMALDHFTGSDAARSYARAYYFALLADAAGDVAAPSLIDEINARFSARGEAVAAQWADFADEIEAAALADWIEADLPARYATTE